MTDILQRLSEPWRVVKYPDCFQIVDGSGRFILGVSHRQDLHNSGYTTANKYLSESEAETIAHAIAKLRALLRRPQY